MANVADLYFSTIEGKIQAVGSRKPVRLGRDPSEFNMSALAHPGEERDSYWNSCHSDIIA